MLNVRMVRLAIILSALTSTFLVIAALIDTGKPNIAAEGDIKDKSTALDLHSSIYSSYGEHANKYEVLLSRSSDDEESPYSNSILNDLSSSENERERQRRITSDTAGKDDAKRPNIGNLNQRQGPRKQSQEGMSKSAGVGSGIPIHLGHSSRIDPNLGSKVLEWTGQHMKKQQQEAQNRMDASKSLDSSLSHIQRKVSKSTIPHRGRMSIDQMPSDVKTQYYAAERKRSKITKKFWAAHEDVADKGRDIENMGLVNKHLRKTMQKSFAPLRPEWALDEKEFKLETKDLKRQEKLTRDYQAKFREQQKKKEEADAKGFFRQAKELRTASQTLVSTQGKAPAKQEVAGSPSRKGSLRRTKNGSPPPPAGNPERLKSGKVSKGSENWSNEAIREGRHPKTGQSATGSRNPARNLLRKAGTGFKNAFGGCVGKNCLSAPKSPR